MRTSCGPTLLGPSPRLGYLFFSLLPFYFSPYVVPRPLQLSIPISIYFSSLLLSFLLRLLGNPSSFLLTSVSTNKPRPIWRCAIYMITALSTSSFSRCLLYDVMHNRSTVFVRCLSSGHETRTWQLPQGEANKHCPCPWIISAVLVVLCRFFNLISRSALAGKWTTMRPRDTPVKGSIHSLPVW